MFRGNMVFMLILAWVMKLFQNKICSLKKEFVPGGANS